MKPEELAATLPLANKSAVAKISDSKTFHSSLKPPKGASGWFLARAVEKVILGDGLDKHQTVDPAALERAVRGYTASEQAYIKGVVEEFAAWARSNYAH